MSVPILIHQIIICHDAIIDSGKIQLQMNLTTCNRKNVCSFITFCGFQVTKFKSMVKFFIAVLPIHN